MVILLSISCPALAIQCPEEHSNANTLSSTYKNQATAFSHQFDSGARWELCWHIDDAVGLTITHIHYGPPGETSTQVIEKAAIGQILFKYDEDTRPIQLVSESGFGDNHHNYPSVNHCHSGEVLGNTNGQAICSQVRHLNLMTNVRRSASLPRHELSLHANSNIGSKVIQQRWRFSEDGQITPTIRLSGELDRFTNDTAYGSRINTSGPLASNATILVTWRLGFNIAGTPDNDVVEQIEFLPNTDSGVKRSITNKRINRESFRKASPENFRGWIIRDTKLSAGTDATNRMGYFLDPQQSGFSFTDTRYNWTSFDLAITKNRQCEHLASDNSNQSTGCGDSLDDFVDGETLINQDPVVWFSLARQFIPNSADFPAIQTRDIHFTLAPFDWSASTPFSPLSE